MYLSVICFSFSCSWLWGMWGSNNVFFPLSWSLKSGRLLKITSINSQLQCVHSPWVLPGQEGFLYMMSTQFLRSSWGSWTSWSFYSSTLSTTHPSEVVQSCPDSCDPVDCSLPGSSIHGIFQARVLEWAAKPLELLLKRQEITSFGENVEPRELLCTVDVNVNWYNHYGQQYGGSSKNYK